MVDSINNAVDSQLIFNDGHMKGRLIKKEKDWYVGEWKYINDLDENGIPQVTGSLNEKYNEPKNIWFPWICGTSEYLGLTAQEKEWAK